MRKLLYSTIICTLLMLDAQAQNGAFGKNDKLLNIGIGVNSFYDNGVPFGASLEKGINDNISVGANFDYLSSDFSTSGTNLKFTALYLAVRGSYHFNTLLKIKSEKIDLYAGPSLGYRKFSWKDGSNDTLGDDYGSSIFVGLHIGGKYYFTEKIGAFLELGDVGSTNARLGVAFRFK